MKTRKCWWCKLPYDTDQLVKVDNKTGFLVCRACKPQIPPFIGADEFNVTKSTSTVKVYRCALVDKIRCAEGAA